MDKSKLSGAILICGMCLGCGASDGKIKVYPVSGKVLVKGQPAAGARVVFYPTVDEIDGKKLPTPGGEADESGEYRLESYTSKDGAPAGDYKVGITWLAPPPPNATGIFDQKDRLAGRFSNPQSSKRTAHIEKGGAEVPPFELQ